MTVQCLVGVCGRRGGLSLLQLLLILVAVEPPAARAIITSFPVSTYFDGDPTAPLAFTSDGAAPWMPIMATSAGERNYIQMTSWNHAVGHLVSEVVNMECAVRPVIRFSYYICCAMGSNLRMDVQLGETNAASWSTVWPQMVQWSTMAPGPMGGWADNVEWDLTQLVYKTFRFRFSGYTSGSDPGKIALGNIWVGDAAPPFQGPWTAGFGGGFTPSGGAAPLTFRTGESSWGSSYNGRTSSAPASGPREVDPASPHYHFYYLSALGKNPGTKWTLRSMELQASLTCMGITFLNFDYYLYGPHGPTISLKVEDLDAQQTTTIWGPVTGNTAAWQSMSINMAISLDTTERFRLIFEATVGSGDLSDVAIDEIWFGKLDDMRPPPPAALPPPPVPTAAPTLAPTPTAAPTEAPTTAPTEAPTDAPTTAPTDAPTTAPTDAPTTAPTDAPTAAPTDAPTAALTDAPTTALTDAPTAAPTNFLSVAPTTAATPTTAPTDAPTNFLSVAPTTTPTNGPTNSTTGVPTTAPTNAPTNSPNSTPPNLPPPPSPSPSNGTVIDASEPTLGAASRGTPPEDEELDRSSNQWYVLVSIVLLALVLGVLAAMHVHSISLARKESTDDEELGVPVSYSPSSQLLPDMYHSDQPGDGNMHHSSVGSGVSAEAGALQPCAIDPASEGKGTRGISTVNPLAFYDGASDASSDDDLAETLSPRLADGASADEIAQHFGSLQGEAGLLHPEELLHAGQGLEAGLMMTDADDCLALLREQATADREAAVRKMSRAQIEAVLSSMESLPELLSTNQDIAEMLAELSEAPSQGPHAGDVSAASLQRLVDDTIASSKLLTAVWEGCTIGSEAHADVCLEEILGAEQIKQLTEHIVSVRHGAKAIEGHVAKFQFLKNGQSRLLDANINPDRNMQLIDELSKIRQALRPVKHKPWMVAANAVRHSQGSLSDYVNRKRGQTEFFNAVQKINSAHQTSN